ncbi:bifunctional 5,10-methylene-tetrahydrofolate dehydrogenase and 5,10-methylene-tetrahydrofolate cyclohydrolase [Burkholderiales bacterium]|nr:bifunctional 5,10-methylene-tetrahydrofolate dehydrogenase and 5,10-methylene-tetrahydrofolate cyclohydrolase [Burkholderiales bacterium]
MTASILDGKAIAQRLRAQFRDQVAALAARGQRPGLAVVLVGENPASQVYVRNKVAACEEAGMFSENIVLPASTDPARVIERIEALNRDPRIHGILVQLPLPRQYDEAAVLAAVSAQKDVDGFHTENVGALALGNPRFIPCTPKGVMVLLQSAGIQSRGSDAVIVGRSNIVGRPMARLLLTADATVTVCHSRTRDLASHTRRADILVAAVGRPAMITADMVKPGAVVIDVGINRLANGKLCGDVDFASVRAVASWITPVPGGVGPMTIAMLLANTIEAAQQAAEQSERFLGD